MKVIAKFSGLFFCLLLLFNGGSFASKFMASDFGWQKIGQDSFLITLTIYKDCNGASLGTAKIYFKCASTNSIFDSLLISAPSGTEVTPVCSSTQTRCQSSSSTFPYGIQRYIYQGIIYLNQAGSCCNIRMCYQDTNRNSGITTGAASQPFYTEAVFNRCISPNDHAPGFSTLPIEIICMGQDHIYKPGILGNDTSSSGNLDSITYEWAHPLRNYNDTIYYTGQYAYNKSLYFWGFPNEALAFPRGIHLDPQTGNIYFRPMKPEITVMVVKVKEYRNGTLIGEIRREIQTIIITCTNNNPPYITTPNFVRTPTVCAGVPYSLTFSTNDPNSNDSVTINWNGGIPGATFTTTNGQSKHPQGTFRWTPTDADVSSSPYTYTVTARDNACPISATFTQAYQVTVKPMPTASYSVIDSGCGNYYFEAQPITGTNMGFYWTGQGGINKGWNYPYTSTPHFSHHYKNPGIYPFSLLVVASGCSNTYYDTIVTDTFLNVELSADSTVCYGTQLFIQSQIQNTFGLVRYLWSTSGSDTLANKTITVIRDTLIYLLVSDLTGCVASDSIKINIRKPISLTLGSDIRICSDDIANLKASYKIDSGAVNSIIWKEINSNKIVGYNTLLINADSGLYLCTVTDTFGCTSLDTIQLIKNPEVIASVMGAVICYGDEVELQADTTGGGIARYFWYSGTKLIGSTQKIKVKPITTTYYLLTVIVTIDGVSCYDSLYVIVRVNPLPVISISAIEKRCVNGAIINLNNYVKVDGIPTSLGLWTSLNDGLLYGDKFDPVVAGVSIPPGWKVKFEYTDPATGCYNKDSGYVTIYALPNTYAGLDDSICKGTMIFLTGNPLSPQGTWRGTGVEGSYPNWKFNTDATGIIDGGTYDVIYHYKDMNNCENEDTVKITVNPKPPVPVIALTPSDSFLECNLANGFYEWFYRPDTNSSPTNCSIIIRHLNPRLYCQNCYFSVVFTDSNGCVSDTSNNYHFQSNSIKSSNQNSGIRFYPNPAHSLLFIENTSLITSYFILTNVLGNTLLETNIIPGKNELSLTNYKPGIYFIFMDGMIAGKLIIE